MVILIFPFFETLAAGKNNRVEGGVAICSEQIQRISSRRGVANCSEQIQRISSRRGVAICSEQIQRM